MRSISIIAPLVLGLYGCDRTTTTEAESQPAGDQQASVVEGRAVAQAELEADVEADAEFALAPDAIDLAGTVELIERGEVQTAAELEVALNDRKAALVKVDLDVDGEIDPIQVVEIRDETEVRFEILAIPSTKLEIDAAVAVAYVDVVPKPESAEVQLRARYAASIEFDADADVDVAIDHAVQVEAEFKAGVIVGGLAFVRWSLDVERPVFYGVYVIEHRGVKIPPGHLKHGHWKADGDAHVGVHGSGHGKLGAHASGHAKGHAKGKTSGKVHASSSSGGGGKVKGKIDIGGKAKVGGSKAKSGGAKAKAGVKVGGGIGGGKGKK